MKAAMILKSIKPHMNKARIFDQINRAIDEMTLLDIHQVAAQLGGKVANVRARAINNGIGTKVGRMGRVYTPADVEALRSLIKGGQQPKTVALRDEMAKLKAVGLTNRAIAGKLGVDPSYVTKLLK